MSELVDDLERLGIVERGPDPRDGGAELICPTDAGWEATGRRLIARDPRTSTRGGSAAIASRPPPRPSTRSCAT
jgi:hypothetical protein